jgi:hypothetical protein
LIDISHSACNKGSMKKCQQFGLRNCPAGDGNVGILRVGNVRGPGASLQLKELVPKLLALRQDMVRFGRVGRILLDAETFIAVDCVGHRANLIAKAGNCNRIPSKFV